jgi:cytochrome c oxidase assembly protein subunit 15
MNKHLRNKQLLKNYGKLAVITVAAVYLLILVGGIVRSTGSGMGCPDWPKCFGSWVPPTSADQLPSDYKQVYAEKRDQKNQRFASLLDLFGFHELAGEIRHDESILVEADFNALRTWIEYLNRLTGVVIGLLIITTVLLSFRIRKAYPRIFIAAVATLVLVIFQGWLGSIVVSTNLLPWMVTVHMLPALLIVALLIWTAFNAREAEQPLMPVRVKYQMEVLLVLLIASSLLQIVMGTQVREQVDEVAMAHAYLERESWIDDLGLTFYVHRSFSILILLLHLLLFARVRKFVAPDTGIYTWTLFLMAIVGLEIISGAAMAWFAIPAFLQPMHLLFGTVLFGNQFYLLLLVHNSHEKEISPKNTEACLLQEAGN